METAVIIGIVALAVIYIARSFYHKFTGRHSTIKGCSCSGCGCSSSCGHEPEREKRTLRP